VRMRGVSGSGRCSRWGSGYESESAVCEIVE
jgi:hypothetical protein